MKMSFNKNFIESFFGVYKKAVCLIDKRICDV